MRSARQPFSNSGKTSAAQQANGADTLGPLARPCACGSFEALDRSDSACFSDGSGVLCSERIIFHLDEVDMTVTRGASVVLGLNRWFGVGLSVQQPGQGSLRPSPEGSDDALACRRARLMSGVIQRVCFR